MKKYIVIGNPIEHSLSPKLHNYWIKENNINNLHHFIDRGLFYFGPTWNHSLSWVSSSYDEIHNQNNVDRVSIRLCLLKEIHHA